MYLNRFISIGFLFWILVQNGNSQSKLLERQDVLSKIRVGIDTLYRYDFHAADSIFAEVEKMIPDHPVNPFLKGLVIYWDETPLTPFSDEADEFLEAMEESIIISREITEKNEDDAEGVFFDLVSSALILMYNADNGESNKVISRVWHIYRLVMKGFDMDDEFPEFRFFTGLYNYYREVYPEIHPVYKPITMFLPPGDKTAGWEMLHWIKDSSLFMRADAMYFLSHICVSFLDSPEQSIRYTQELLDTFPQNNFFRIRNGLGLVSARNYKKMKQEAEILLEAGKEDSFAMMAGLIYMGLVLEKLEHDYMSAKIHYIAGLRISEKYGVRVDNYSAIANLGLSRIYKKEGEGRLAREFWKKAKSQAKYEYILKDR